MSNPDANIILPLATWLAVIGCGLMSGLFFDFSNFAMRALGDLPPAHGMAAMQRLNVRIINPLFLAFFLLTPIACLIVLVLSVLYSDGSTVGMVLVAGSLSYLIGGLLVTVAFNVPRNNALESLDATDPASAEAWHRYRVEWTRWNHVRTVASVAATALLSYAMLAM